METFKKALQKFAGLVEEIADKDLSFIQIDNFYDYIAACRQLGISPNRKIVEYLEAEENQ